MPDIRTIGAGGGSIARIDDGGLLRVGPTSAGADPGPACYGRGGEDATLTDADLVLGRLDPEGFLAGEVRLDQELSRRVLDPIAAKLAMTAEAAALAIVTVANNNMAQSLRAVSVERGIDPRGLALVAFGGAGGLHACEVAREVGTPTVLVPPFPGNTSAMGLLTAGLRSDATTTLLIRSDAPDLLAQVNAALGPLRARVIDAVRGEGGTGEARISQHVEMRYYGQNYHREIELSSSFPLDDDDLEAVVDEFHQDYGRRYGYSQRDEPIEVVGANVAALIETTSPELELSYPTGPSALSPKTREVYLEGAGWRSTTVLGRADCRTNTVLDGPLIVEEGLSTTLVAPSDVLTVLPGGTLSIAIGASR